MFDYLELKRTRMNPITSESLDAHLAELKKALDYIMVDSGKSYSTELVEHQKEINEIREKLK